MFLIRFQLSQTKMWTLILTQEKPEGTGLNLHEAKTQLFQTTDVFIFSVGPNLSP